MCVADDLIAAVSSDEAVSHCLMTTCADALCNKESSLLCPDLANKLISESGVELHSQHAMI